MLRTYVELREQVMAAVVEEDGSEVAQAAGVALAAVVIIGAIRTVAPQVGTAVTAAFTSLIGAL